jgi:hypothetical protein
MTAIVLSEGLHAGAYIVSEHHGYSRDQVTVALNQSIAAGQVVGKVAVPGNVTSSSAADAGNTGNGTLTLDATAPVASNAQDGTYRIIAISAGAGAEFLVEDPKGVEIGRVAAGATFANQIKFAIAAGGTAFAVGDTFTVTVGRETNGTDEQVVPWTPTATDGSQNPVGIMMYPVVTDASATKLGTIHARHAEVRLSDLTFGGSPTAAQQAECIEQLRRLGIVCR